MNQLKKLREDRAKASDEKKAIRALCEKENRNRNADEKTKWAELTQKIKDLDDEIKDFEEQEAEEARSARPVNGGRRGNDPEEEDDDKGEGAERRDRKPKETGLRAVVAAWQKRNADAIKSIRSGVWVPLSPMEISLAELRAADSPMTPTTVQAGSSVALGSVALGQMGAPIIDLLRVQPTLWSLLPKGNTSLETYPWINKKVPANSGAADFLAPGSAKPPVSFTLTVEKSNAKKPAVSMKVATELLEDIDGMVSQIEGELKYQLDTHINSILMGAAAASSTDPAGIRSYANAYTLSGVETTNPNNYDCVLASHAQIRAGFIGGTILSLMHPVDVTNMRISKAISQGQYMGLNIAPIPGGFIVEDYNIPVGGLMSIGIEALKTLIYKPFRIAFGHSQDDFEKNLITAIGESRIHNFHSENHAAAFFYDELADIKTAIAQA